MARVDEAVLGFIDSRFRIISPSAAGAPDNAILQRAVVSATALRHRKHAQPAVKETWRSALDPSDEAFLSAFRALECIRRLYGEGETDEERKAAWRAMSTELGATREPYDVLAEAAKAVRHGNRPVTRGQGHAVNAAHDRRDELLGYATNLVRARVGRDLGVDLS